MEQQIPIGDEYCWDSEHEGGWTCRQCRTAQAEGVVS